MNKIESFRGRYFFASNFYEATVSYEGLTCLNSEALFQAMKSKDPKVRAAFAYITASEAKKLGQKVELRPDWEQVKDKYMYEIVKAKFNQNPDLKARLLATGDAELIEGNLHHDNTWGRCDCSRCEKKVKENRLGKILERIRKEFKDEQDAL